MIKFNTYLIFGQQDSCCKNTLQHVQYYETFVRADFLKIAYKLHNK